MCLKDGHSDFFALPQRLMLVLSLNYCLIRKVQMSSSAEYLSGSNIDLLKTMIINEFHIASKKEPVLLSASISNVIDR